MSSFRLLKSATFAFVFIVLLFHQTASAQSGGLNLYKNYFVTGDYVVGGVGLRGLGNASGFATGTISIPDQNTVPAAGVPAGANVVAAFLYWQTVESSQSAFAGQNGFFNHRPIVGSVLGNPNAPVSWSAGGCSGSANGSKTIRTYRADVRPILGLDQNGNTLGNGSYEVRLADSGSNGGGAPLTLGASLVVVYRVLSPAVPLKAVILYDGVFAPSNSGQNMTLPMQGFYQAATAPVAKLTHIVANGQPNKFESVTLNSVPLTSLYGSLPPFPGFYNESWDNPTWISNTAVHADDSIATTSVIPSSSNSGCVSWGAVILSSPVQDTDGDGLLNIWEQNGGYIDAITGASVALPGANPNAKDLFVEVDYLQNLDGKAGSFKHSHEPKKDALDKVGLAFHNAGVSVHFDLGATAGTTYADDSYVIQGGTGGNAISESAVVCTETQGSPLCEFPDQPVVGWKAGFLFVKDNPSVPGSNPAIPLGNFQAGRANSYHYVLFGHTLGSVKSYWSTAATALPLKLGLLNSIDTTVSPAIVTIQSPAYFSPLAVTGNSLVDRITISGAIGQPALNGTYVFSNVSTPDINGNVSFSITTSPNVTPGVYTFSNESQLAMGYGGPTPTSGYSDVGGADSMVTFGLWPADDDPTCQPDPSVRLTDNQTYCDHQVGNAQSQAGTLMHEIGHTFSLTHGGRYGDISAQTYGMNCKPNFLSVMNYLFQIRGFNDGVVDYSGQSLADLNENSLSELLGLGTPAPTHPTRWYGPPSAFDLLLGTSRFPKLHCDGTPLATGETPNVVRVDGTLATAPFIDWNNDGTVPNGVGFIDVNFNGSTATSPDSTFEGFNDWANFDLRQIGARWNVFGFSDAGSAANLGGGSAANLGGGSAANLGGGSPLEQGGGSAANLGGGSAANLGGGSAANLGGGSAEVDFGIANSTVDSPVDLNAVNDLASNSVKVTWSRPAFGQIRSYFIYRMVGPVSATNPITKATKINTVAGLPLQKPYTFFDSTVKNKTTYTYFGTAALADGTQSAASNISTVTTKF
jgi:hypothetical protein